MMSSHTCAYRGMFRNPIGFAILFLITLLSAGCGGGGGGGSNGGSSQNDDTDSLVLVADVGGVCETLLQGEVYTGSTPSLSCNNDADPYTYNEDPYTAYLDGSRSTTTGSGALSYAWSFVYKPDGSHAVLTGANSVNPTFVPDVAGPYAVQLVVSSQGVSSPRAVALVDVLGNDTLHPTNPTARRYFFHGGLSSNCSACHSGKYSTVPSKSGTHISTSNLCQTCHSPEGFIAANYVDHAEVFGVCSDCHNGVIAIGKSAGHVETSQECSDCHTSDSFLPLNPDGSFDHTRTSSPCSTCHNGVVAPGTNSAPNHPSVSVECNNCHTTATFSTPFINHSTIAVGTCGSCHDGDKPLTHPVTGDITQACDLCHNTTTFDLDGLFDHDVLARHPIDCRSCHDGVNATGMNVGHVAISADADCSDCHHTSSFVGGFVDHTSSEVTSKACTDCHNGTDAPGAPSTPEYPLALETIHTDAAGQPCSACHTAGGSFDLATIDHSGFGTMGPSNPTDCNSCHDGVTATGKSDTHQITTAQCSVCHDPQSDTFAGGVFDHSTVSVIGNVSSPSCVSCHDGTTALGRSVTHVPLPTPGEDCLVCHGTGFTSFAVQTFDHTAAGITDNCASCHDGLPHDGVVVIAAPNSHIPTTDDCSACHTDTTNGPFINGTSLSGFTTATRFVSTVHPAYTTGCSSCHNGSYDNAVYGATFYKSPVTSTHNTANNSGWECNACHTTTGGFAETNPVNHLDPAVAAQTCVSCHDGSDPLAIGKSGSHPTTSDSCQDCHQTGGSFVAGFDHATLNPGGANEGLACAGCHNGLTATGKNTNHMPTTRDCSVCHAGYPSSASSFAGGSFSHSGPEMIGHQCMDCHNNTIAIGKSASHLVTNADCGACHTTEGTFDTNATGGFDHTDVTTGCAASGCHASGTIGVVDVTDDPNPLPHIPIMGGSGEINCYSCHRNNVGGTFANASMDHSVVASTACESCHDGGHDGSNAAHIVTPKPSNHFVTSITACASCHTSTSSWGVAVTNYNHIPNDGYPGNHNSRSISSCDECHDSSPPNANISGFPHATYGKTCAACHESDGTKEHGRSPLSSRYWDCGDCHRVTDRSW